MSDLIDSATFKKNFLEPKDSKLTAIGKMPDTFYESLREIDIAFELSGIGEHAPWECISPYPCNSYFCVMQENCECYFELQDKLEELDEGYVRPEIPDSKLSNITFDIVIKRREAFARGVPIDDILKFVDLDELQTTFTGVIHQKSIDKIVKLVGSDDDQTVAVKEDQKSIEDILKFVESDKVRSAAVKKNQKKQRKQVAETQLRRELEKLAALNHGIENVDLKLIQTRNRIQQLKTSDRKKHHRKIAAASDNLNRLNTEKIALENKTKASFNTMKKLKPNVDLMKECSELTAVMGTLDPPPLKPNVDVKKGDNSLSKQAGNDPKSSKSPAVNKLVTKESKKNIEIAVRKPPGIDIPVSASGNAVLAMPNRSMNEAPNNFEQIAFPSMMNSTPIVHQQTYITNSSCNKSSLIPSFNQNYSNFNNSYLTSSQADLLRRNGVQPMLQEEIRQPEVSMQLDESLVQNLLRKYTSNCDLSSAASSQKPDNSMLSSFRLGGSTSELRDARRNSNQSLNSPMSGFARY